MGSIPAIAHQRITLISGWKRTNLPSFPLLLGLPFWRNPRPRLRLAVFAEGNGGGGDHLKGERRGEPPPPPQFELRWRDLLNPDPENIVAVGLAGLLTWASVQVLVQLFFISVSILLAALNEQIFLRGSLSSTSLSLPSLVTSWRKLTSLYSMDLVNFFLTLILFLVGIDDWKSTGNTFIMQSLNSNIHEFAIFRRSG